MAIRFNRLLAPAPKLDPQQWTSETASGQPAVRCPSEACGAISEIPSHEVMPGGRVHYIWSCPSCPFVGFIELDDYDEVVVPA